MPRALLILTLLLLTASARAADRYGRPSLFAEPPFNLYAEQFANRRDSAHAAAYWYAEAMKLSADNRHPQDALDFIRRAVRLNPRSREYRHQAALALWNSGTLQNNAEFIAALQDLAKYESHRPGLWAEIGNRYANRDDFAAAEPAYRRAIREAPDDQENYLRLAELLGRTGRGDEALALLRRWRHKIHGLNEGVAWTEFDLRIARGRPSELREFAADLKAGMTANPRMHLMRAVVCAALGEVEDALAEFATGQTLETDFWRREWQYQVEAETLHQAGRFREAATAWAGADSMACRQRRWDHAAEYRISRARNLDRSGGPLGESIDLTSAALQLTPKSVEGWEFKTSLLSRAQRWEDALAAADERLRLVSDSVVPEIFAFKLRILNDWRDQQKFLGTPDSLITAPSDSTLAATYDAWAAALEQCGKLSPAEHACGHALTFDSTRADYYYRRACIRAALPGHDTLALEDLTRAVALEARFATTAEFDDRFAALRSRPEFQAAIGKPR